MPSVDAFRARRLAILVQYIEQRERADPKYVNLFVSPRQGLLQTTLAPKHHFVFGRRGSGKTSLLLKSYHDLSSDGHPVSIVDVEPLRSLERHAAVVSILRIALEGFLSWIDAADSIADDTSTGLFQRFLTRFTGTLTPRVEALCADIREAVLELRQLTGLERPESQRAKSGDGILAFILRRRAKDGEEQAKEYLAQNLQRLAELLARIGSEFKRPAFLFIDDFYRLPSPRQPYVAEYLHLLVKNRPIWLKIGSIRNRTSTSAFDPAHGRVGVNTGNDFAEIDLDASLEHFVETKEYLERILHQLTREAGLQPEQMLTPDATDRLVRGSGGVARDFLLLLKLSIRHSLRDGDLLKTKDVYAAIEEFSGVRRAELASELDPRERERLLRISRRITDLCIERRTNIFLVKIEDTPFRADILSLMDLKAMHLVRSSFRLKREDYQVFMLDLSLTTPERDQRRLSLPDFDREAMDEDLRRGGLVVDDQLVQD